MQIERWADYANVGSLVIALILTVVRLIPFLTDKLPGTRRLESVRYCLGSISVVGFCVAFLFWRDWLSFTLMFVAVAVTFYNKLQEGFASKLGYGLVLIITIGIILKADEYKQKPRQSVTIVEAVLALVPQDAGESGEQLAELPFIDATLEFKGFEDKQPSSVYLEVCNKQWNYLYIREEIGTRERLGKESSNRQETWPKPHDLVFMKGIWLLSSQITSENDKTIARFFFPISVFPFQSLNFLKTPLTEGLQCRIIAEVHGQPLYSEEMLVQVRGSVEKWSEIIQLGPDLMYPQY